MHGIAEQIRLWVFRDRQMCSTLSRKQEFGACKSGLAHSSVRCTAYIMEKHGLGKQTHAPVLSVVQAMV